ncbi:hypothetical protein K432DRAFT_397795, partial [Lepidopterella palustris CBS 459.81]
MLCKVSITRGSIVFVHGFTGHPERTWSQKREESREQHGQDNGHNERPLKSRKLDLSAPPHQKGDRARKPLYWPQDLIPTTVPNARVLTYGYDPIIRHSIDYARNKSTFYDITWDFLVELEAARRVQSSRPLLFISHSLGGIVIKEALLRSHSCQKFQKHLHSIYEFTAGMIFFGTPHASADPRGLIQHVFGQLTRVEGFVANEQIVNAFLPSKEQLKESHNVFGRLAREKSWTIHSFQEQYGDKVRNSKKVVEDTASCLNDPTIEVTQHIASNHMDMCRYIGLDDVEYQKVVAAIHRILGASRAPTPFDQMTDADQHQHFLECLRFDQIDARHATIKTAHARTSSTDNNIIISLFFNARGEQLEKSALGMYRSLLFQLLEKVPNLQKLLNSPRPSVPNNFDQWNIETVKNLFGRAVESLGRRSLTCFIDALDECEEDQVREMVAFFERLGQFAVSSQIQLYVCFSSRHYPHITIEKGVHLILEGQEGHQQDIADYLNSELKAGRSKLTAQIKEEILKRASGIFLWVVLVVQMLNKEFDRGRVHTLRKRLDEIPDGLDKLFQDILTRDGQDMEDLVLCLQWILYAKRPLKSEELYFAILAGVAPEAVAAWNPEEITKQDMERFVLSSSKGLAETTKGEHQTVQFIHESVRDFLLKGNGLNKLQLRLHSNFPGTSNERLKKCCQTYMDVDISEYFLPGTSLPAASSGEVANLRQQVSQKFPFLEYAVCNVLYQADAAGQNGISQNSFVETFFLERWVELDNLFERYQIRRHTSNSSLLYILAEQNLPNLIQIELGRVPHMDINGERYGFPSHVALAQGNENAVRALLIQNNRV